MTLSQALCDICSTPLSVHERATGSTCAKPVCQQTRVRREAAATVARCEQHKRDAQRLLERDMPASAAAVRFIAIVPSSDRPITVLPARRTSMFRHRLMQVITRAAERRWGSAEAHEEEDGYPQTPPALSPEDANLMASACGTCRGHCCQQGGEHAFIHPHTILTYWEKHPDHRPVQVLEAYLSHLPQRSVHDSCMYHGDKGCTLPPDMTSHICKRFICRGAAELLNVAKEVSPVAIAATRGDRVTRVAPAENQRSAPDRQSPSPASPAGAQTAESHPAPGPVPAFARRR